MGPRFRYITLIYALCLLLHIPFTISTAGCNLFPPASNPYGPTALTFWAALALTSPARKRRCKGAIAVAAAGRHPLALRCSGWPTNAGAVTRLGGARARCALRDARDVGLHAPAACRATPAANLRYPLSARHLLASDAAVPAIALARPCAFTPQPPPPPLSAQVRARYARLGNLYLATPRHGRPPQATQPKMD
jgi:hypothetical protein